MNISKLKKELSELNEHVFTNDTPVVFKLGNFEYEIQTVGIDDDFTKCILKIDETAELDIIYRIIETYKQSNKNG